MNPDTHEGTEMEHFRATNLTRNSSARTETFTGQVYAEPRITDAPGLGMNSVLFTPGARTYWHRHEGGQLLHVTAGSGVVGTRDGTRARISPGDTIWASPGEEHFHGATADCYLLHEAISHGAVEWQEEVNDQDYRSEPH